MAERDGAQRRAPEDGAAWSFMHPPRGTCLEGCVAYGTCHCGCGERPKLSGVTYVAGGRYRGQPYVFVSGHYIRVVHPRAGMWSRNGVDVGRIRPLLFWLRARYGSMRAVASILGMPESTVRGYVYNTKRKRVPGPAAHRIVSVVLRHRATDTSFVAWESMNQSDATSVGWRAGPSDRAAGGPIGR